MFWFGRSKKKGDKAMYALIESVGMDTNISLFDDKNEVELVAKERYNKKIKEVKDIDWRNTFFDEEKRYGKISNWIEVIEFRYGVDVVDKRKGA